MTWQPVPGASLAPAQAEHVDHARVFLRDGTVLELDDAVVRPDSIVGQGGIARMAVRRDDVVGVDTKGAEPVTTFLGGALAGLAALFVTFAVLL